MNQWKLTAQGKIPRMKNPVLLEGMPGIGNVGKVAVDFIIDELDAVKIFDIFSYSIPNSVFVGEDNLVELPTISMYFKKGVKGPDLLLLAGDVQPIDEVSCYAFCETILDVVQKHAGTEIMTLGGIGLPTVPKSPKLYLTGNTKKVVSKYRKHSFVDTKLYGVVGPIMGVSGLLLGLAGKRDIPAVSLLAETYGHPMYLGIKGAREIVRLLNIELKLGINLKEMDREIRKLESEMTARTQGFEAGKQSERRIGDVNYIG